MGGFTFESVLRESVSELRKKRIEEITHINVWVRSILELQKVYEKDYNRERNWGIMELKGGHIN